MKKNLPKQKMSSYVCIQKHVNKKEKPETNPQTKDNKPHQNVLKQSNNKNR